MKKDRKSIDNKVDGDVMKKIRSSESIGYVADKSNTTRSWDRIEYSSCTNFRYVDSPGDVPKRYIGN